jgi:MSHA pilin protein MshD
MCIRGRKRRQRGATLVELVVFIVVVGASVAGVLMALDRASRASSDPLVSKQALAIAEALLDEVQLMPFTICDPDDPAVSTATVVGDCTVLAETLGPEAGETRYHASTPFDNVNDYNGYNTATEVPSGIKDITNTPIPALSAYNAQVSVAAAALGSITQASGDALQITVTVTGPFNTSVSLQGYRTRYAPRL